MTTREAQQPSPARSGTGPAGRLDIRLIGLLKLVQGAALAFLTLGLLRLIDKAVDEEVARWLVSLHLDLDSPWIQRLLDRLAFVTNHQLRTLSTASGIYAVLLVAEGTGLYLRRLWGEYFTILVTGSFLPLELFECIKGVTLIKVGILAFNAAVLAYLVIRVVRDRHKGEPPAQ